MYTKKTVVYAKIETTMGSGVTPSLAANAVMAYNVNLEVSGDMKERASIGAGSDRSAPADIRGKTRATLSFDIELKGSGTEGTAPRWSPLLEACDRSETAHASTDVVYTPAAATETVTIYVNIDGIEHRLYGCAGDCEIELISGEIPLLKFNFSGIYTLPTDVVLSTPTFDATIPEIVKGTTFTLGLYSVIAEKINLKFGNSVVERTDFNATEGIKAFIVGNRRPSGMMTCETVLMATTSANFWSYFNSSTVKALSFVLGATAGNIITITAPVCVLSAPKYGDREGIRTMDIEFQMARSAGNDEMTLTLT